MDKTLRLMWELQELQEEMKMWFPWHCHSRFCRNIVCVNRTKKVKELYYKLAKKEAEFKIQWNYVYYCSISTRS
jgi:hypothetical protein